MVFCLSPIVINKSYSYYSCRNVTVKDNILAKELLNCFENYEFFGEFFENECSNKGRFVAKIKYSPEKGLQLEYSISDNEAPNSCERLFGVLSNGNRCTLIGDFNFDYGTHHVGEVCVKSGIHGFKHLVLGDFINKDQLIEYMNFTFNGMQEFIHPQTRISQLKYQESSIVEVENEDWRIEVNNKAIYIPIQHDLKNIVDSNDKEAKTKFDIALDVLEKENPKAYFRQRKSLTHYIEYSTKELEDVENCIKGMTEIASLFSILMSRPVFPDEIELKLSGKSTIVNVLNSMVLETKTVELAKKELRHELMPLNWKQLDMSAVFLNWFKVYDDFRVLSTVHQYETGYRTLHYAHSDIVLYSVQLESINLDLGGNSTTKYIKPIETYASLELCLKLKETFKKVGHDDLGEAISILRNELAHVGRPKKMMKLLNINDYIEIGRMLKLIVISHLFSKLSIALEQTHKYQNRLM